MDTEILLALGLKEDATSNDVLQKVKFLNEEVKSKTNLAKRLSEKVADLELKVDQVRDRHSETAIDTIVLAAQSSVGHYLPENTDDEAIRNVINIVRQKARMMLDCDSDEERESIESDIKTYCMAYGYNSKLENQLKKLNGQREIEAASESERIHLKATQMVKDEQISYTEAVKRINGGN